MYDINDSFLAKAKQTVYKWWCVVYKPVYKLTHHGYWPEEKEPGYQRPKESNRSSEEADQADNHLLAEQMARQIGANRQNYVDNIVNIAETENTNDIKAAHPEEITDKDTPLSRTDTANVDSDVLSRANEIMERLAREAAEDEAKKQAEIAEAKKQAEEQERLASIMKANEVDISSFIAEGKAQQRARQTSQKEAE